MGIFANGTNRKGVEMTDKEVLDRLKKMYIEESAKLRRAKLAKERDAARRAVEVLGEVIDWIERVKE